MLDLTPILAAVLPIVLPPLIGTVVVFAKKEEAKLPTNLQPIIESLATQAVNSAEQSLFGQPGNIKFDSAASWLADALKRYGVSLTSGEIKSAVESAVYSLNESQGKQPQLATAPVAPTAPAGK